MRKPELETTNGRCENKNKEARMMICCNTSRHVSVLSHHDKSKFCYESP